MCQMNIKLKFKVEGIPLVITSHTGGGGVSHLKHPQKDFYGEMQRKLKQFLNGPCATFHECGRRDFKKKQKKNGGNKYNLPNYPKQLCQTLVNSKLSASFVS